MTILSFLVELLGATMLLLYAVRMVRTGIERAFGASFQRVVTTVRNPVQAAGTGLVMAIILQSSAAVALLVSGFAGSGALAFGAGLAIVLGADLGSALLIQVLSFKLEWLIPLLLAVGGGFFVKFERRKFRQTGRILLGIAFILISLQFLREAMDPIRSSAFLPAIASYLEQDFLSAFIVGIVLAFLMHSSVAAILMCVTLVAIEAIPVMAGMSLVLGANFGSALIPVWLTRGFAADARPIPVANLIVRGTGAILAVFTLNFAPSVSAMLGTGAQALINAHIAFNCALLLTLPFCHLLEPLAKSLLPPAPLEEEDQPYQHRSALDDGALDNPVLAISSLKREVMRMQQLVDAMMTPVMGLYDTFDKTRARALRDEDLLVNDALDNIRRYAAAMNDSGMKKSELKQARSLTEYAIALESAGDIVVKRLLPLAESKAEHTVKFTTAGQSEITSMHEQVIRNLSLAANVLVSEDIESARLLLEEKTEMNRIDRSSRKKHLKRLGAGEVTSLESSDIHLESLRAMKDFNSQIAAVAYPILYKSGQLLETRLIQSLDSSNFAEQ